MRILFDLITLQNFVGGSAEYTRKVFSELIYRNYSCSGGGEIFGIIDSKKRDVVYGEFSYETMTSQGITVCDISKCSLAEIVRENKIDKIFIGCGQYWMRYDLSGVDCPIICVIHDLWEDEFRVNKINDYLLKTTMSRQRYLLHLVKSCFDHDNSHQQLDKLINAINRNNSSKIVTVSEYSKYSLIYNYHIRTDKVVVLYSPERIFEKKGTIVNPILEDIINKKKKFYLMVSTDRYSKNAEKAIRSFKTYSEYNDKEALLVTVGYKKEKRFHNHVILPLLSESDLLYAYENCYAFIYSSMIEGFGYPPIEAIAAGKPILCSNVTSIPEISGEAAIYFSPFYETDIYMALAKLTDDNYNSYREKARLRYEEIKTRQNVDLNNLVQMILA